MAIPLDASTQKKFMCHHAIRPIQMSCRAQTHNGYIPSSNHCIICAYAQESTGMLPGQCLVYTRQNIQETVEEILQQMKDAWLQVKAGMLEGCEKEVEFLDSC